ncbi:hypothetical protein [Anabaena azotica]|uniref:Uncharacterized protein n=1 Tax=Anabaena azotica FACHB-119 TaxID=947527 RepID=A0ABR8CW51_9NOST|nr:hypothetical protein [Anabaena azotica]MBD2499022.1 hypothetical protein [Anabaena azotica FACHB-119]
MLIALDGNVQLSFTKIPFELRGIGDWGLVSGDALPTLRNHKGFEAQIFEWKIMVQDISSTTAQSYHSVEAVASGASVYDTLSRSRSVP